MRKSTLRHLASVVICAGMGIFMAQTAQAATPIKIMALGDSITLGTTPQSASNASFPDQYSSGVTAYGIAGGYRNSFYNTMAASGQSFTFVGSTTLNSTSTLTSAGQARHEGHGGYTVGQFYGDYSIAQHISTWMNANPDVILLHIGTNDMLWSRDYYNGDPNNAAVPKMNPTTVAANLNNLLNTIFTRSPNVKIFLAKIIPLANDFAWLDSRVDDYNNRVATLVNTYKAQGKSIYLVDQYANFSTANGTPIGTHLPDGIHPDQAGYNMMGVTWANAVIASTVPEPASLGLVLVSGVMLMRRRKVA